MISALRSMVNSSTSKHSKIITAGLVASLSMATWACKPPVGANDGSDSGLSEVAFPIPEDVKKGLGGSTGKAELRIYLGAVKITADRVFSSDLSFKGGGQGGTVSFSVDDKGNGLKQGEKLDGIYLYILNSSGKEIYSGKASPNAITLSKGANNISVSLECEDDAVCGQENYQVVGIAGDQKTVSSQKVSLSVKVSVNKSGSESSERTALRGCIDEIKKFGCDDLEKTACNAIFKLSPSQSSSLQYEGTFTNSGTVKGYLKQCEQLGVVKKV